MDEDEEVCEICHEPLSEECACSVEYNREHDNGAER